MRLPRFAGEANLPDKTYRQELSLSSYDLGLNRYRVCDYEKS